MSKKKNKKKDDYSHSDIFGNVSKKSKKKINKEFQKALDEIQDMRIQMYEADKISAGRKKKKKINKEEVTFYTNMDSIKCRKKISKKWEKEGFMDQMIILLKEISPFVQLLARALASLITMFLSIPFIKQNISTNLLSKITTVFDIAIAM